MTRIGRFSTPSHLCAVFIAMTAAGVVLARCGYIPRGEPCFEISDVSVIGFGPDASDDDFEELNDLAIAHDDFVTSWASFTTWAQGAGVRVHASAPHFTVSAGGKPLRVREPGFGYLLVEPSGRQKLIRGVQTDSDLVAEVCDFFASTSVRAACSARP